MARNESLGNSSINMGQNGPIKTHKSSVFSRRETNKSLNHKLNSGAYEKEAVVTGEVYLSDQKIGIYQMRFEVSNTKYIVQKHACSLTEDGVVNMSAIETYGLLNMNKDSKSGKNKPGNDSFSELCKSYDEIVKK